MDGLHDITASNALLMRSMQDGAAQRTLSSAICCVGVGLHSEARELLVGAVGQQVLVDLARTSMRE